MPTAAPTRCLVSGCAAYAVARGRCADHYVPWEQRSRRNENIDHRRAARWRRDVMRRDDLCTCGAPATEADHIIPVADGGARYDVANGQGLCSPCHARKTRDENAERNRARTRARNGLA